MDYCTDDEGSWVRVYGRDGRVYSRRWASNTAFGVLRCLLLREVERRCTVSIALILILMLSMLLT